MYRFALKTLIADRGKLLTALVGVVFSLVLVNVQGGLYFGLMGRATTLIDNCDADIWVGHRLIENVELPHDVPEIWLNRIRGLPDVAQAEPYIVGKGVATLGNGGFEDIWIMGADPGSMLGSGWNFEEGDRSDLLRPDSVSFDEFDSRKLGDPEIGSVIEINGRRARIVARTSGIVGFMTTPYLFATLENARQFARIPPGYCSYLLVRARPGADVRSLSRDIRGQLPDADVLPAEEFARLSREYWMERTGIGVSFGASTLLGLLVGLLMVAQSLYALALDHISDYATLKAIGAENGTVYWIVVVQALTIAAAGVVFGTAIVLPIQQYWSNPLAPIQIPRELLFGSIGLVFVICLAASLLPFQRIRRIDPVIVLQA